MFSKRIRLLATFGVVCLVGGIGAGAGVLIYQSRKTGDAFNEQANSDLTAIKNLFPEASSLTQYPFLNYVRPRDLNLNAIADLKVYANNQAKFFNANVQEIAKQVFANALVNANYWTERTKFLANQVAYKQSYFVQRITDQELHLAVGVSDAQGKTWYDVGKVSL